MLLDKKESAGKKNRGRFVIGYDLSEAYAQISYFFTEGEEPETLAVVTGTEQYNIPLVLCKRREVNQWFYGKEALKHAQAGDGELVKDLLSLARKGEAVAVGSESFDPKALLTLFIKRSLSLLSLTVSFQYLDGLMFTVESLDKRMVEVLSRMAVNLNLKTGDIFFQSHLESFYYYTLYQPKELWTYGSMLFDYDGKRLRTCRLHMNRNTTPVVVFIDGEETDTLDGEETEALHRDAALGEPEAEALRAPGVSGEREPDAFEKKALDRWFSEQVRKSCGGRSLSSAYLIGDGFKGEWMTESLRLLCQGKRVFQGNNLYGKGACYALREKKQGKDREKEYVFLGTDKLKANIGMKVLRRGMDSYFAVMDAGVNWYEAKREYDVILEAGNSISIILTPLTGKDPREISMVLDALPARPARTTRLHITVEMASESQMKIKVRDLGFGDLFPSSGGEWMKLFEI